MLHNEKSKIIIAAAVGLGLGVAACGRTSSDDGAGSGAEIGALSKPQLGAHAYAVLKCKYPDNATDAITNAQVHDGMVAAFNNWSLASYGSIAMSDVEMPTCQGTGCTANYILPKTQVNYFDPTTNVSNFGLVVNDCMTVANADFDFSKFFGVIVVAVGGFNINGTVTAQAISPPLDGVSSIPAIVLSAPNEVPIGRFAAHEIGHSIGLPHINPQPPSGVQGPLLDVMASGGLTNTNMYHKDFLGWIPAARKLLVSPGTNTTITLDRSAQPSNAAGTFLMAELSIPGTGPLSGTGAAVVIEARQQAGIDASIPHEGVVVYYVDPTQPNWVFVFDPESNGDVNELSSFLQPGQTHANAQLGLTIQVLSRTTSGYQVQITYSPPACTGNGFTGQYFDNIDFTNLKLTRVDPNIQFDFGNGSPDPSIAPDTFSIRWQGQLTAPDSGLYTFHALTDDGVRLTVNNQVIIDQLVDHCCTPFDGSITLQQGQRYPILMEYFQDMGGASARLSWTPPGFARTPIFNIPSCLVASGAANQPPSASITAPTSGATFAAPATITINATATDSDGTVSQVQFFQGSTLLGSTSTAPYSFTWTNVPAGTYSLTAKAFDNLNATGTSAPVTITVNPGGGTDPCAGLCTSPIVFAGPNYQSGNLGTGAACRETTSALHSGNCSNMSSRVLTVNGTVMSCSGWTLPPTRNGGYCVQVTAGTPDFASFATW
jgi:hypothetical protein